MLNIYMSIFHCSFCLLEKGVAALVSMLSIFAPLLSSVQKCFSCSLSIFLLMRLPFSRSRLLDFLYLRWVFLALLPRSASARNSLSSHFFPIPCDDSFCTWISDSCECHIWMLWCKVFGCVRGDIIAHIYIQCLTRRLSTTTATEKKRNTSTIASESVSLIQNRKLITMYIWCFRVHQFSFIVDFSHSLPLSNSLHPFIAKP